MLKQISKKDLLIFSFFQGLKERQGSSESLDIGYGKCPEFVCVDGLIVSRESGDWRDVSR